MIVDELVEIGSKFTDDLWNGRRYEVAAQILSPKFQDHDALPGQKPGATGYVDMIKRFHTAYPDLAVRNDEVLTDVSRNMIVLRWSADGTHRGELMGIGPTGRPVHLKGIDILKVEDAAIVERWGEFDALGMFRQIGQSP